MPIGFKDASGNLQPGAVDGSGNIKVAVTGAGSGGTSSVDEATFTAGTTAGTPAMGAYQASPTSLTDGQLGIIAVDANRNVKVNIVAGSSGNAAAGPTGSAVPADADYQGFLDPANSNHLTGAAKTNIDYDTGAGTFPMTIQGIALPASGGPVAGGTSANPVRVDPTGTTTQPVSAASLPLPTGAATAAKQPALGVAGTPSADVISVQGVAGGTVLPVSAAALPLPTNAAQETGGNLAAIKADTDKIPSQGQALAAASMPVVLTAAQITTLTPPAAITNYALETGGHLATVDTSTAAVSAVSGTTAGAAVITDANGTIQQYLRGIIKLAITAGGWLVTASIAAGTNLIGKVGIDQTTPGTTNGVVVNASALTLVTVAITASSSGDNTLVAAAGSGNKIKVYSYALSFSGTVNAKFTDGASGTNVGGLYYGVANAGAAESVTPINSNTFLWAGTANTALILNLSDAVAVGGVVRYFVTT